MNYLLLISCSQRKIETETLLPAIERYDGPVYRCLRKYRDTFNGFPNNLRILILSAKYRLIMPETEIDAYDFKMTADHAEVIGATVQSHLTQCFQFYNIAYGGMDEVFLNLGKTYMQTLDGFHWETTRTLEASGGIGQRVQQMRKWLGNIQ